MCQWLRQARLAIPVIVIIAALFLSTLPNAAENANAQSKTSFTAVSVGTLASCAISTSFDLFCWGSALAAQPVPTNDILAPKRVGGLFSDVDTFNLGTCAISHRQKNALQCWGEGVGFMFEGFSNIEFESEVDRVSLGEYFACVHLRNDKVWCFGDNSWSQLGLSSDAVVESGPIEIKAGRLLVSVDAGDRHVCAIDDLTHVWCWGNNIWGSTGNGSDQAETPFPSEVTGLSGAIMVSSGGYFSCALTDDTGVWCWGHNSDGRLGNGSRDNAYVPVRVANLTNVTAVSAGGSHACALTSLEKVWCWGRNESLIWGSANQWETTPQEIQDLSDVTAISAGRDHTCAIKVDGSIWCWGQNNAGQLGIGTRTNSAIPVQVIVDSADVPVGSPTPTPTGADDKSDALTQTDVNARDRVQIIVAEDGTFVYGDERVSTSAVAASLRDATSTLTSLGTYSGGLVTILILALLGILLEFPFNWIEARAKGRYLGIMKRLRSAAENPRAKRLFGIRVDVIAFLVFGQVIVQLNAPLALIPPIGQLLQTALLSAAALLAISAWYALPRVLLQRRTNGDIGEFRPEWPSLLIALLGLAVAQLTGIVPGFLIGLFTVRKFRRALPDGLTAGGTFVATIALVLFALIAWAVLDALTVAIPEPTEPLRKIGDGLLGVILVAGSQGALINLLDPGDEGAMALRRKSLLRWLVAVGLSGLLAFALLAAGKIDIALFAPPTDFEHYIALLLFAIVTLGLIIAVDRLTAQAARQNRSTF